MNIGVRRVPCAAAGCGRKAPHPFSNYCSTCAMRIIRNGSPHASALDLHELKLYRDSIRATVHRHRASPAVQGALALAGELLNYTPAHDFTVHHNLRTQMQRLLAYGVTPEDVVCRVAEFVAWEKEHPIELKREQQCKLAMAVLKLAPLRGWHKRNHVLLLLAQLITEGGLW